MPAPAENESERCSSLDRWTIWAFEFSALAFLPALIFTRGLHARVIELGIISWLVWEVRKRGSGRKWATPGSVCLGLFSVSLLLSSCFSFQPQSSLRDFLVLLHGLVFCLALQRTPAREGFWGRLGVVVFVTLAALGIDVLTQQQLGTSLLSDRPLYKPGVNSEPRVTGPFSNPNFLFVIPVLFSAVWMLPHGVGGRRRLVWGLAALGLGLGIWAALLSGSRNVFLACAVFVFFAGWSLWRWKGLAVAAALGIALATAFPQGQKILGRIRKWETADYSRLSIWRFDLALWKEHPWLGIGPKMFPSSFTAPRWDHLRPIAESVGLDITQRIPQHPHNAYLEALVERGLLGLISFLALAGFSLREALRARVRPQPAGAAVFLGLALSLWLLCALFDFSLGFRVFSYLFLFLCGLCGSLSAAGTDPITPPRLRPLQQAV